MIRLILAASVAAGALHHPATLRLRTAMAMENAEGAAIVSRLTEVPHPVARPPGRIGASPRVIVPTGSGTRRIASRAIGIAADLGASSSMAHTEDARSIAASRSARDTVLPAVDSLLDTYIRDGRLAGAVTLVIHGGEVVHRAANGVRDLATRAPLRTDDIFRIASQTKAITSVAAMTLVEAGLIDLEAPVSTYLPEFRSSVRIQEAGGGLEIVPTAREVTIRDLLTHTSGISYGTDPHLVGLYRAAELDGWYFADSHRPMRHLIRRLPELPFAAGPGEKWIYGLNTDVLGVVIEKVTGAALGEVLRRRVFDPLGMEDTHFHLPGSKRHRLAAVHAYSDGRIADAPAGGAMGQGEYADGLGIAESGGAGLLSTADDYARFLMMLRGRGAVDGVRILREETVDEMTRNQVGDRYVAPGYGFGLGFEIKLDPADVDGWDVPGVAAPGSFGWGGAYHSTYWVDPRNDLVVVFLTQIIPASGLDLRPKLKRAIYRELGITRS